MKDAVHLIWLYVHVGECVCASVCVRCQGKPHSEIFLCVLCVCLRGLWSPLLTLLFAATVSHAARVSERAANAQPANHSAVMLGVPQSMKSRL